MVIDYAVRILLLCICIFCTTTLGEENHPMAGPDGETHQRIVRPIESLTAKELWELAQQNPCYLPLVKDSSIWDTHVRVGFDYKDLFNDRLPAGHKYRNRYLVGDFNVLDLKGQNRGILEIFPRLSSLKEFDGLPRDLVTRMDTTEYGSAGYGQLIKDMRERLADSADIYINFLEKVWKYKLIPINRPYSIAGGNLYSAGQNIVLCEACGDTLVMLGKFATSAKRQTYSVTTTPGGNEIMHYWEEIPVGGLRWYYAGMNRLTTKNWEHQRRYEELDKQRDLETGGGNSYVTYFRQKAELPNFMLISADPAYRSSVGYRNGIHECALAGLALGMLGTANSIGCIRVSDFGSKFLRWWTPMDCKFFITYDEHRYHKRIELTGPITDYLPFKTQVEGDRFRRWLNEYKPFEARVLEIDSSGDYKNGYIIDAYYYLKDEYDSYRRGKRSADLIGRMHTIEVPANFTNPLLSNINHCKTDM
jgi:hypothetical protein